MTPQRVTLLLTCLLLLGCPARHTSVALDTAVKTNNTMVAALTEAQEQSKLARLAAMVEAAQQADSWADGQERLDAVELRYDAAAEAFREIERVQNALADSLVLAQAAVAAGDRPEMAELIGLYVQLQQCYTQIVEAQQWRAQQL